MALYSISWASAISTTNKISLVLPNKETSYYYVPITFMCFTRGWMAIMSRRTNITSLTLGKMDQSENELVILNESDLPDGMFGRRGDFESKLRWNTFKAGYATGCKHIFEDFVGVIEVLQIGWYLHAHISINKNLRPRLHRRKMQIWTFFWCFCEVFRWWIRCSQASLEWTSDLTRRSQFLCTSARWCIWMKKWFFATSCGWYLKQFGRSKIRCIRQKIFWPNMEGRLQWTWEIHRSIWYPAGVSVHVQQIAR